MTIFNLCEPLIPVCKRESFVSTVEGRGEGLELFCAQSVKCGAGPRLSVHMGCPYTQGRLGIGASVEYIGWSPPWTFALTAGTQLSVSFSQVRMQAEALDGLPRGPRRAGVGEPERALGRCWSQTGPS